MHIGVLQGCTASTILFDVAFQMLIDIHQHLTKHLKLGYTFKNTCITVTRPAYADDMTVQRLPKHAQQSTDAFLLGCDYSRTFIVKVKKCKSFAMKNFDSRSKNEKFKRVLDSRYSSFDPLVKIGSEKLMFIGDDVIKLFKYLGLKIQFDLGCDLVVKQINDQLDCWLADVDELLLTGPMKAWIVNHHVCAKLGWVLMIYNFSNSQAAEWQKVVHKHYRKWMGLAKSAEGSILYRSNLHFGLNFIHLGDMQRQYHVVKWHILKYSQDPQIRELYKRRLSRDQQGATGKGRKGAPSLDLEHFEGVSEQDFKHQSHKGKAGLGLHPRIQQPIAGSKEHRHGVIQAMKSDAEEKRLTILHGYEMQNTWMTWGLDALMQKDLTWHKLINVYSEELTKFVLNGITNTLPTPDNYRRWGVSKICVCGLCGRPAVTLRHILAGCSWVRSVENKQKKEDRYTWRHNCLLLHLANAIIAKIVHINKLPARNTDQKHQQTFVKKGEIGKRLPKPDTGTLYLARDWKCNFELPEFHAEGVSKYRFPEDICATSLRIDGYIVSRAERICCLGPEMTSPMGDNIAKWHRKKTDKYQQMVSHVNQWSFPDLSVEVGALGFIPPSTHSLLKKLGFTSKELTSIKDNLTHIARKCSYMIFVNRFNKQFLGWRIRHGQAPSDSDIRQVLDTPARSKLTASRAGAIKFLSSLSVENTTGPDEQVSAPRVKHRRCEPSAIPFDYSKLTDTGYSGTWDGHCETPGPTSTQTTVDATRRETESKSDRMEHKYNSSPEFDDADQEAEDAYLLQDNDDEIAFQNYQQRRARAEQEDLQDAVGMRPTTFK
jgi:hypothetical protein